jgi:glycosyltransferase involved in cell wall biosynthesis
MKIGYLCSSNSWGGLEMNHLRNAVWMKDRLHEVVILCVESSPLHQRALQESLPIILIDRHRKYYDFKAGKKLAEIIENERISHLMIRDNRDVSVSAIAKRNAKKHPFHLSYFMEMQLGVKKTNIFHTLRFRKIDLWSCPLNWLKSQVETMTKMDKSKVVVIPSGLDLSIFQTELSQADARALLELPADKKILGMIGRFDPAKGQLLLLEALKSIQDPSVCVCLLGEPTRNEGSEYFEQLKSIIKENKLGNRVFIRPFRDDIVTFYRAIDAFVMASKAETFGMVTIEAMASETPTIGSNAGGTPEILGQGKFGYLFETLDVNSLTEIIEQFLKSNHISKEVLIQEAKKYDHHLVCSAIEKAIGLK